MSYYFNGALIVAHVTNIKDPGFLKIISDLNRQKV
jgi:hypothetical protein